MRRSLIFICTLFTYLASVSEVCAQRRMPHEGGSALGVWLGAAVPNHDTGLDNGLELAGTAEAYVTPRVSLRGEVGTAWFNATRRGFAEDLHPLFVNGNVVYNWEGGGWHPYVTAGVGLYQYRLKVGSIKGKDNELGANFGGGIEYFVSRRATLVGDGRYHSVGDINAIAPFKGSFWTISMGFKRYF